MCAKLTFPPSFQKEDCVRERSICRFRALLCKTVCVDKYNMKKCAWKALVCVLPHE